MIIELCLLIGLLAVASNPSPYYAALGLVGGAGAGCLVLIKDGVGFLSLVLFLIYLGGMMVVFAYCAALVAEPYPEAWGSRVVIWYLATYNILLIVLWAVLAECGEVKILVMGGGFGVTHKEWLGVGDTLCSGGWILFFGGWALLLTLFVILEVVRGYKQGGALRAVRGSGASWQLRWGSWGESDIIMSGLHIQWWWIGQRGRPWFERFGWVGQF